MTARPDSILIAAASDAHGRCSYCERMIRALPPVAALCYLGDTSADAEYLRLLLEDAQPQAAFHSVAGNNGAGWNEAREALIPFGDKRVLITHGHLHRVKLSTTALARHAREFHASAALFGHTHIPLLRWEEGLLLVNPGALMDGRYALLTIDPNRVPEGKLMSFT